MALEVRSGSPPKRTHRRMFCARGQPGSPGYTRATLIAPINIAARIEGLADIGGICISDAVYQQVKNSVKVGFENLGPQRLKNIREPVEVFRITRDANTAMRGAGARTAAESTDRALRFAGTAVPVTCSARLNWNPIRRT